MTPVLASEPRNHAPAALGAIPRCARPDLVVWDDGASAAAEAFRQVVASLLTANREHMLLFSGSRGGEGVTSVAANVALALAEIARRTLLVDANLRRPRIHRLFGLSNRCGLSDLLDPAGGPLEFALAGALAQTFAPQLTVLPSGPGPATIARWLYSERWCDLTALLRRDFACVLLDAPGLATCADARIVAARAGCAAVLVHSRRTGRNALRSALDRLSADGIEVAGTVFNTWRFWPW